MSLYNLVMISPSFQATKSHRRVRCFPVGAPLRFLIAFQVSEYALARLLLTDTCELRGDERCAIRDHESLNTTPLFVKLEQKAFLFWKEFCDEPRVTGAGRILNVLTLELVRRFKGGESAQQQRSLL